MLLLLSVQEFSFLKSLLGICALQKPEKEGTRVDKDFSTLFNHNQRLVSVQPGSTA